MRIALLMSTLYAIKPFQNFTTFAKKDKENKGLLKYKAKAYAKTKQIISLGLKASTTGGAIFCIYKFLNKANLKSQNSDSLKDLIPLNNTQVPEKSTSKIKPEKSESSPILPIAELKHDFIGDIAKAKSTSKIKPEKSESSLHESSPILPIAEFKLAEDLTIELSNVILNLKEDKDAQTEIENFMEKVSKNIISTSQYSLHQLLRQVSEKSCIQENSMIAINLMLLYKKDDNEALKAQRQNLIYQNTNIHNGIIENDLFMKKAFKIESIDDISQYVLPLNWRALLKLELVKVKVDFMLH